MELIALILYFSFCFKSTVAIKGNKEKSGAVLKWSLSKKGGAVTFLLKGICSVKMSLCGTWQERTFFFSFIYCLNFILNKTKSQGNSQKQIIPRCKGWLELLHIIVILRQYEWAQSSLIAWSVLLHNSGGLSSDE